MNAMTETIEIETPRDFADPTNLIHNRRLHEIREILVLTDLTVESRKAITYAVTVAQTWNAHLTLLHVYKEPHNLQYMRGSHVCEAIVGQRQYSKNALELLGEQAKKQYANCDTEFRDGTLCEEIANSVRDLQADLMIIGTHENRWFQRIAYGSDAEAIIRLAPCPVLVVREPNRDHQAGHRSATNRCH